MLSYIHKTKPYDHQQDEFLAHAADHYRGLFWEQGTGKTKELIDQACHLYMKGMVSLVIVVAPNGVQYNWQSIEIPIHAPDICNSNVVAWTTTPRKAEAKALDSLWDLEPLHWLVINYEATPSDKLKAFVKRLMNSHKVMFILDESHRIKTWSAQCSKALRKMAKFAAYRRLATGTSITQGPLDLYSQMNFLSPDILPQQTWTEFKHRYAEIVIKENKAASRKLGRTVTYEEVVSFRNIAELERLVSPYISSIKKIECLDLPEKVYEEIHFKMSPNQKRLYNQMRDEAIAIMEGSMPEGLTPDQAMLWMLSEPEGVIAAKNGGVKLLRLQQILGGYLPDSEGKPVAIDKVNPRIKTLMDLLSGIEGKVIIWARFRAEIAGIVEAIEKAYASYALVQYHGGITGDDRKVAVKLFQYSPECRFFIGNATAGGTGLTLTAASTMIYFSKDFNYGTRAQSEDRIHRIGQTNTCTYYDIHALGTVDMGIMKALKAKADVATNFNFNADKEKV